MADLDGVEQRRRDRPRFPAPADASLRGVADSAGLVPFVESITDISFGGMGVMIYVGSTKLAPGMMFNDCCVDVPGRGAMMVDLEVRYTIPEIMPDGASGNRVGVRFLHTDKRIKAMFDVFMDELHMADRSSGHWIA